MRALEQRLLRSVPHGPRYHGQEPRRTASRGRSPCPAGTGPIGWPLRRPDREARRRAREPGQPVRGDAPQRRLDGAGPAGGPGRAGAAAAASATRLGRSSSGTSGLELALAKPQTYMNDSGVAVRKLLASYHVPLVDLLVVTDDFALPFGKLRFREGGAHGGHNGLRSIIEELGTEKFSRLRVGIGEPGAEPSTTCSDASARRARAAADPPRRGRGRGRGVGARRDVARPRTGSTPSSSRRRPTPPRTAAASRARSAGPADANGDPPHEDRLATDPPGRRRAEDDK